MIIVIGRSASLGGGGTIEDYVVSLFSLHSVQQEVDALLQLPYLYSIVSYLHHIVIQAAYIAQDASFQTTLHSLLLIPTLLHGHIEHALFQTIDNHLST